MVQICLPLTVYAKLAALLRFSEIVS